MNAYFMLLHAPLFHKRIAPVLAASWRRHSFDPCRQLCTDLATAVRAFQVRYHTGPEEPLLLKVTRGLPFDRHYWTLLAGEIFLYAASDIPEIEAPADTLCCLLALDHHRREHGSRMQFAPIQQVLFGARDLVFGGKVYCPEAAGYNDRDDILRLAGYLDGIDPGRWTLDDLRTLASIPEEADRADELDYVREWFPALQQLYRDAAAQDQVILFETLVAADY